MKLKSLILLVALNVISCASASADSSQTNADSLYREVVRTVADVDFEGMAALYHPDAVLVTATMSKPISMVIPRWKSDGEKLQREGGVAFVSFRFSSRLAGKKTTFDTGIFRYGTRDSKGIENISYIHFQDLNVQKDDQWLTLMERQMDEASLEEWEALPAWE